MINVAQKSTHNYDLFENHEQNRLLGGTTPRRDLLISLRQKGFRKAFPIVCVRGHSGKLRIIDGHNRLIAAIHLGIAVEYVVYHDEDVLSPVEFSSSQKQWKCRDYAIAFSHDSEKPDYLEVMAYSRDTGIPINGCFSLFAGEVCSSSNQLQKIKSGTYKIKNREIPAKVGRIVAVLNDWCDFGSAINLVNAVSKIIHIEGIDLTRLLDRIRRYPEWLRKQRTTEEYIEMLESIYNRNTKLEKLYFRAGVDKAMAKRKCVPSA